MRRPASLFLAGLLTMALAGCAATKTLSTGKTNRQEVWIGCLDAVSNYLHVNRADPVKGAIEARSVGQWERNLAKIQIQKKGDQYDVTVGVYVETSTILTRPSGLRAGEEEHLSDLNILLRETLISEIKQRLHVEEPSRPKWPAKPKPQAKAPQPPKSQPQAKAVQPPKGTATKGASQTKQP